MARDGTAVRQLTHGLDNKRQPAWSPDGSTIAFVTDREGDWRISLMDRDGGQERRLTAASGPETSPTWSPDGRLIAFARNGDLFVIGADGSGERRLTQGPEHDQAPAWSPRGDQIAFLRRSRLHVMAADGSAVRHVVTNPPLSGRPSWAPDGSRVVSVLYLPLNGRGVFITSVDGPERSTLVAGYNRLDYENPNWSPDGRSIALNSGCRDCDPSTIKLISSEGTGERRLTPVRRRYAESVRVGDVEPAWSPDGSKIVFARNTAGTNQVYSIAPDGSDLRRISHSFFSELRPVANSDGSTIAFFRPMGLRLLVHVMDGTGRRVRRLPLPASTRPRGSMAWSPEGRRLAVGSDRGLWILHTRGSRPRRVVRAASADPSWSPGGGRMVYTRPDRRSYSGEHDGKIFIVGVNGSGDRAITLKRCLAGAPDWSPTGDEIAFHSFLSIFRMRLADRRVRVVLPTATTFQPPPPACSAAEDVGVRTAHADGEYSDPEWSPDGQALAVQSSEEGASISDPAVYVVTADGRGRRRVAAGTSPSWITTREGN